MSKTKKIYYILSVSSLLIGLIVWPLIVSLIFEETIWVGLSPIPILLVLLFFMSASIVFLVLGIFEKNKADIKPDYKPANPLITLTIGVAFLLIAIFEIYITDPATLVLYIGGPILIISGIVGLIKKHFRK